MLRKTVKSGKNVIRLNGVQPATEIVASIGAYLTATGRHETAIRYLESIEHHLNAASRGKGIVPTGNSTLLGTGVEPITAESAARYLATLAAANGAKAAESGNIDEAVSYYEAANTPESILSVYGYHALFTIFYRLFYRMVFGRQFLARSFYQAVFIRQFLADGF